MFEHLVKYYNHFLTETVGQQETVEMQQADAKKITETVAQQKRVEMQQFDATKQISTSEVPVTTKSTTLFLLHDRKKDIKRNPI